MNDKVVLGLSDGVDSAVAAILLRQTGYDVHGLYMDISDRTARETAERSASEAGIDVICVDVKERMERYVCGPFAECYRRGMTPNPCIGCNPNVKFRLLAEYADEIGADRIATGHYSICDGEHIYMGSSDVDQSYMLQRLSKETVKRLLLPMGTTDKAHIRTLAREYGLSVAGKPDSRENCFIKNMSYIDYLEDRGITPPPGDAVYNGEIIGRHEGIHRYTVGQRWNEMIGDRRAYISRIDPVANIIELVLWEDLFKREFDITDLSLIDDLPDGEFRASVRVRHTRWETPACTVIKHGNSAHIVTDEAVRAPCPGQAAALYSDNMLLGGGYII